MIREDTEFQNIPIIFLTGKNDAQTVMEVMSLKPDGYLLKSMDAQKLHAAIDDFFKNRQNKNRRTESNIQSMDMCGTP